VAWRIVYIEESEQLSLYLDNLKVHSKTGEVLFPIDDIQTLVIDNYKTTLSVQLINKLTQSNVNIILCGLDHLPVSYCLPFGSYHASALMIRKQVAWKADFKKVLHQKIVQAKIENQNEILRKHNADYKVIDKLNQFISEVEEGDKTNREGLSARLYFWELFGKEFIRFSDDVVNAGMNYGYSILRSKITSILVGKGLNTCLGIFHRGPQNQHNLSDDIIEVFRPIVDDYVKENLVYESIFKKEHRDELISLVTKKILFEGKRQTITNVIGLYIDNIIKCMEEYTCDYYSVPTAIIE